MPIPMISFTDDKAAIECLKQYLITLSNDWILTCVLYTLFDFYFLR